MSLSYNFPNTVRVQKKDNMFQHLEVLKRNRVKRKQYNEIFVEGVQPIKLALANEWQIVSFVYSRDISLSDWAVGVLDSGLSENVIELPLDLMKELSDKEETSEILAVVSRRDDTVWAIPRNRPFTVVIIDRSANPGNLGTIVRTCDAFGTDGIILFGHSVDPFDPQVIRASVGTIFCVPVTQAESQSEIHAWIESTREKFADLTIIGTSAKGTVPVDMCNLTKPCVFIVGNETYGVCDFFKSLSDVNAKIPQHGSASSLNVAAATSIMLYESYRQRAAHSRSPGLDFT